MCEVASGISPSLFNEFGSSWDTLLNKTGRCNFDSDSFVIVGCLTDEKLMMAGNVYHRLY